jgi:hypothetical protein
VPLIEHKIISHGNGTITTFYVLYLLVALLISHGILSVHSVENLDQKKALNCVFYATLHFAVEHFLFIFQVRVALRSASWPEEGRQAHRGGGEGPARQAVQQDREEVQGEAEGLQG